VVRLARLALASLAGLVVGCTIATPFRQLQPEPEGHDATVVLVLTHAIVDNETRAPFDDYTARVVASLKNQPGLIGYAVRRQLFGNEAWTMTVWRDDAARAAFVLGTMHQEAMLNGGPALTSARFRRLQVPASEVPVSWRRAEELLDESSRGYAAAH
jgi:heme-degrading monooxygenase HmoA